MRERFVAHSSCSFWLSAKRCFLWHVSGRLWHNGPFGFQAKHFSGGAVCERKRGCLQQCKIGNEKQSKAKQNLHSYSHNSILHVLLIRWFGARGPKQIRENAQLRGIWEEPGGMSYQPFTTLYLPHPWGPPFQSPMSWTALNVQIIDKILTSAFPGIRTPHEKLTGLPDFSVYCTNGLQRDFKINCFC